jgi:hypothetical protein
MRSEERPFEGWYYKQDGQAFGPIPTGQLKELLAAGRLQPRQAVWQRSSHGLHFVHAATAAVFDVAECHQPFQQQSHDCLAGPSSLPRREGVEGEVRARGTAPVGKGSCR